MASPRTRTPTLSDETRGLWLGFLGMVAFGITLPMTRLAVGSAEDPQLAPVFVTAGRAAIAGLLSIGYLLWQRARWPDRRHWWPIVVCALGTVVGFPLFLSMALREVHAIHAAVITGILPLASAVTGAIYFRQRPSLGFWACALAGCLLVIAYAVARGGGHLTVADGLLLCAIVSTAIGYVGGTIVSQDRSAPETICWVLVVSLPLTLPIALTSIPTEPIRWQAWGGLAYVALFSMWLGFFAWYRGLALGGMVRVSQVQLLQPFITLLAAVPLLGEEIDSLTIGFLCAVVAAVFVGRKMPIDRPRVSSH